ncbi:unnamed protein product [Prunus armeniaca]
MGSSRQAPGTGVVPAEGSPMLKSAKNGNFCRVIVKGRKVVTPLTRSGVSAGAWHLGRVSSFGRREGVSALVLVVLRLDMLGSVGAIGQSLVPQVVKLEVALTLGRKLRKWLSHKARPLGLSPCVVVARTLTPSVSTALAVRQEVARTFVEQKGARQKGWAVHGFKGIFEQGSLCENREDQFWTPYFGKHSPCHSARELGSCGGAGFLGNRLSSKEKGSDLAFGSAAPLPNGKGVKDRSWATGLGKEVLGLPNPKRSWALGT